ncbi:MAG TPA: hypothetical protein VGM75_08480 [Pseudonocardiaceae bacterium]
MTAATTPRPAVRTDFRLGTIGLIRLTLRQHRALILGTLAAGLVFVLYLLAWRQLVGGSVNELTAYGTEGVLQYSAIGYSLVVAALWGAPLLAREYEQHTHLLVWSQDVSPTRWLLTKVALLGVIVVGLASAIEAVSEHVQGQVQQSLTSTGWFPNTSYLVGFEANVALQVGYALAAFALGVAIGGLVRVPVLAMVASAAVFGVIRWFVVTYARYWYLPTVQAHSFVGASDDDPMTSRLPAARLIEFGIFLGIAALCLAIAWFGVRRSDAHRVPDRLGLQETA